MTPPLPGFTPKSVAYLRKKDPVLKRVIDQIKITDDPDPEVISESLEKLDLIHSLMRSIIYQQLHAKAASAIHGRVLKVLADAAPMTQVEALLLLPDEPLRDAGLSGGKLRALRDLADKAKQGTIPRVSELAHISDDQLIERLTKIHGIGPWTVHMLLIFTLGRPDVFPIGDFAIRKAISQLYRPGEKMTPTEMMAIAQKWSPYRSVASWYLWRSLDLPKK